MEFWSYFIPNEFTPNVTPYTIKIRMKFSSELLVENLGSSLRLLR